MMLMSRGLPGGQAQSAAIMTQSATKSCPVDAALGSSWAALERFGPRCSVELLAGGDPAALTVPADGGQEQSATKSCPVDACRTWVDSMVIGLSLTLTPTLALALALPLPLPLNQTLTR